MTEDSIENGISSTSDKKSIENPKDKQFDDIIQLNIITPDETIVRLKNVGINEVFTTIKQTLYELVETAYYTNYSFAIKPDLNDLNDVNDINLMNYVRINEYSEISYYISSSISVLTIFMILDDYDVKTARLHVKKLREFIANPPTIRGSDVSSNRIDDSVKEAMNKELHEEKLKVIFDLEKLSKSPHLKDFYQEILMRTGAVHVENIQNASILSNMMKSMIFSGYNPPSSSRQLVGDLFYLDIVLLDGIYHITCNNKGFYVNNSSNDSFDPKPKPKMAYFSHDLFLTMCSASKRFYQAWNQLLKSFEFVNSLKSSVQDEREDGSIEGVIEGAVEGAIEGAVDQDVKAGGRTRGGGGGEGKRGRGGLLDTIAHIYASGKGDQISIIPQWNYPPNEREFMKIDTKNHGLVEGKTDTHIDTLSIDPSSHGHEANINQIHHPHDVGRLYDDLSDNYGIEDRGMLREWNEEIQSFRSSAVNDMMERITQAKFIFKVSIVYICMCSYSLARFISLFMSLLYMCASSLHPSV